MLTRQGWLTAAGAAVLIAGGRILGVLELFVIGAAAAVLIIASVTIVLVSRLRLAVARNVTPPRVYAGSPSRVELSIRNDGERPTPVLRLFDPVTGTRGADLLMSPLEPDVMHRAAYRLPTDRRGIIEIGPLEVVVTDPFGLASSSTIAAPRTELTVYPHIDEIVPVPHTTGDDPHAGADHPSALGRTGEDFYALRPYVVGDDLRRVHWPSTARRDELMVRQDELPWQGRITVLLDVRRNAHTPATLEQAVSAAASIVTASWKRRDLVRLITTDNTDFGFAAGTAHAEAIMEFLATVSASAGGSLRAVLEALGQAGNGGAVVAVVAGISDAEVAAVARLRRRFGSVTIVQFSPSPVEPPQSKAAATSGTDSATIVRVPRDASFVDAWNLAIQRRRRGAYVIR
jgi:uncharacterized protein (DUF58 family)